MASKSVKRKPFLNEHGRDREATKPLLMSDLHWTTQEALETYFRLRSFQEDWDAPGMDAYDAL